MVNRVSIGPGSEGDSRAGQRTPADGYLQYSIHKKEAAEPQRPRHIYTVAGQLPGGLFTVDDERLMFSASRMALRIQDGTDEVRHPSQSRIDWDGLLIPAASRVSFRVIVECDDLVRHGTSP